MANDIFPTNLFFLSPISLAPIVHLSLSSESELIKVLAALIFFLVLFALSSNIYLSAIFLLYSSFKACCYLSTSANSSLAFYKSSSAFLRRPSCKIKLACLGLTILDFSWYSAIAKPHLKIPAAATEAPYTLSSVNQPKSLYCK